MDAALRNTIAKIEVRHGGEVKSRGTGTLVAEGLVLTALHVVGDRKSDPVQFYEGEIHLTFPDHTTRATPVEGKCHPHLDWALLRCDDAPTVRPAPLGDLDAAGIEWTTYGFPDAQPVDGMVQAGTVRNADARLGGQPTYQLFSEEASAGRGAPVKGLSGGPVFVDGALVGVLRFALMKEGQAVAGTLYACPAHIVVEACEGLLPIPDPCHGLPGLPRRSLPEAPYRFLSRYREEDAEIFFGRSRDIRAVYDQVTADDGAGVVLLYGQSGVGKSSFLDAGLVPRLRWTHQVRYLRRETSRSLLATVRAGLFAELGDDIPDDDRPLVTLWHDVEEHGGRPIVLMLDQVEEVYTRRQPGRRDEVDELGEALYDLFHGDAPPRGQILLAFRKEWYPEVQKRLEVCDVYFTRCFLETIDPEGVAEAVSGLTRTKRLRERYGLTVEEEVPHLIARQMHEDPDSPIAPTLQILLTKMWQTATATSAHAPAFTLALYTRLKQEGALLGDFLDQQIGAMSRRRPGDVESGLVLDILTRHTTPLLTADERTNDEMREAYGHHSHFESLMTEMKDLYLLVGAGQDGHRSRLAHDTLAPHVRKRFDQSAHPGQAATRVLISRAPEGAEADALSPLDDHDLETVEAGLSGMRALRPEETALLEASRVERERRVRTRMRVRVSFVVLLVVLTVATVFAWIALGTAEREREITELANTTDKVRADLVSEPVNGLLLSFWAVCRSIERGFPIAPELQMSLSTAVEQARETNYFTLPSEINAIALHPLNRIFAVGLKDDTVRVMTRTGVLIEPILECGDEVRAVAFSPSGEVLYAAGEDKRVRAWRLGAAGDETWNPDGTKNPWRRTDWHSEIRALAVSPKGTRVATGGKDGIIHVWDAELSVVGQLEARTRSGGINALTFTLDGKLVAGSDDGVLRIWDLENSKETTIREGQTPVLAVAAAGNYIASGSADGTVRLFRDGKPVTTAPYWLREDDWKAHGSDSDPHDLVITGHRSPVRALAFDPNGDYLMSGDNAGVVLVHDMLGQPAAPPFLDANDSIRGLVYTGSGVALIAGLDRTVRVRDPNGLNLGSIKLPWPDTDEPRPCVAISADGLLFAAGASRKPHAPSSAGGDEGKAKARAKANVWDVATQEPLRPAVWEDDKPCAALCFAGDELVVACGDGRLRAWPVDADRDNKPSWNVEVNAGRLTALQCDRSGRVFVVGGSRGAAIVVLRDDGDEPRVTPLAPSSARPGACAVALDSEGHQVAISRWDFRPDRAKNAVVELWRFSDSGEWRNHLTLDYRDNHGGIVGLAFSPDGQTLYSVGQDGKLRIRSLTGETRFPAQKANRGYAMAVAVSRDGERVLTGGMDGRVVMWGVSEASGKLRVNRIAEMVPAHRKPVFSVAFRGPDKSSDESPDESPAASMSMDGTLRLWKAHYLVWLDAAAERLAQHPKVTGPGGGKIVDEVRAYIANPPWRLARMPGEGGPTRSPDRARTR